MKNNISQEFLLSKIRMDLSSLKPGQALTPLMLESIATALGGSRGIYWVVDDGNNRLRFGQGWHLHAIDTRILGDEEKNRSFTPGEGMPGSVWRTKRPEWSRDIVKDMMLPRSLRALHLGFEAGIWIPVYHGNFVYGVIEILGSRNSILANGTSQILQEIGEEVGRRLA